MESLTNQQGQVMTNFKPGDWVHIPSLNTEPAQYRSDLCHLGLELWKPKVGEWVVIADDITPDLYAVFQFNNHSKDRQILPFAFLQTLKDQS